MYPKLNQTDARLVQDLLELTYSLNDYENVTFDKNDTNDLFIDKNHHHHHQELSLFFEDSCNNINIIDGLTNENIDNNDITFNDDNDNDDELLLNSDPRKYVIKVCVQSSAHVSYVVGKQGTKIRQIRHETGTFIQTPVNGEEPIFIISGDKVNVETAKKKIIQAAKEYDFNVFVEACLYQDGDRIRNNLFLPARYIGLVVGKKGSMIKRIMDASGTTIITPKVNTENCFKIHGTQAQIRTAINLIKNHILNTSKVNIKEVRQNQVEYTLIIKSIYTL